MGGAHRPLYAQQLAEEWLAPLGMRMASPPTPLQRGAHLTLDHPAAWQICQAGTSVGVLADHRMPHRLRLGFPPLYTRFVDVHTGMARLHDVVATGAHLSFPADPHGLT